MQVVVFTIGDERFAVETSKVQGINGLMKITTVPRAEKYIKGLINLRGSILSVLDINLILGMKKSDESNNNIIVLEINGEQVGITVDHVEEVMNVDEETVKKVHEDKERPFIKGVLNIGNQIITMIDIDKLLQ
ncbi:MAG: chemotaxis protein CheW [Clostridium sp.]|uniref:chemotaxis protein CheW n=1 Tax=Clostridium sp. TaxID=1506 RepID=UPI003022288A